MNTHSSQFPSNYLKQIQNGTKKGEEFRFEYGRMNEWLLNKPEGKGQTIVGFFRAKLLIRAILLITCKLEKCLAAPLHFLTHL